MADLTHSFAHKLEDTHWGKAVMAAFVAGAVFLVLEMILLALFYGESPMWPARQVAAVALGREVLWEQGISLVVLLVALLMHFGLAILFAWIITPVVTGMNTGLAALVGAGFGLALYLFNFFVLTAAYPWFSEGRNWITVVTHLVFGAVLAVSYLRLRYH